MCSFIGLANFNKDISTLENINALKLVTKTSYDEHLKKKLYISKNTILGYKRINILENEYLKQPTSYKYNENIYSIIYNGHLYNAKDIKETLISLGYDFNKYTDEELILIAFIHYGSEIFKKFNGIFSFAIYNESKKELILVRDHLGIKPLYYTILDNTLIFSTEIKDILEFPGFEIKIDKQGICYLELVQLILLVLAFSKIFMK